MVMEKPSGTVWPETVTSGQAVADVNVRSLAAGSTFIVTVPGCVLFLFRIIHTNGVKTLPHYREADQCKDFLSLWV